MRHSPSCPTEAGNARRRRNRRVRVDATQRMHGATASDAARRRGLQKLRRQCRRGHEQLRGFPVRPRPAPWRHRRDPRRRRERPACARECRDRGVPLVRTLIHPPGLESRRGQVAPNVAGGGEGGDARARSRQPRHGTEQPLLPHLGILLRCEAVQEPRVHATPLLPRQVGHALGYVSEEHGQTDPAIGEDPSVPAGNGRRVGVDQSFGEGVVGFPWTERTGDGGPLQGMAFE